MDVSTMTVGGRNNSANESTRERRGREIAERARIVKRGNARLVPSQSGGATYRVTLDANDLHCTCPDFELRGKPCKHMIAAAIVVQRQTVTETTTVNRAQDASGTDTTSATTVTTTVTETAAALRISYPQNWPAYNRAQTQEKALFCRLLHDLVAHVPEPEQLTGRPRIPMADALFSATFKVYSTVSSRRFMTDLREAHGAGFVAKPWHFNTVLKVIEDESLTPTLYDLVKASAAPLAAVDTTFAVDSTGFGTTQYYRHFTAKYGGQEIDAHDWLKLHAIVGTTTNVVCAASITDRNAHDAPEFVPLLNAAAPTFPIQRVVADKAYASRINVRHVANIGAEPVIALKSNMVAHNTQMMTYKADDSAWRTLWHLYNLHRDEFCAKYHARSNVESTFSSMKRVFGDTLRNKTRPAQINELLLKVVAYNIVCVVQSVFELGVEMPRAA